MRQMRVLIIDSGPGVQQQLGELVLESDALQSTLTLTGEEGIRAALQEPPSFIILNAQLADMDGIDVLRRLRQQGVDVPVILISDPDSFDRAVQALQLGISGYLSEPIDPTEMAKAVRRALEIARWRDDRERLSQQIAEVNQRFQRQLQELNAIHAIGRASTSLESVDDTIKRVIEVAVYMTDADGGSLFLVDEVDSDLYLRSVQSIGETVMRESRQHLDGSAAGRAIKTDRPVLLTGERAAVVSGSPVESILYIPLRAPERGGIGVFELIIQEVPDTFSERDIFLLSTLADYAAIAIENARLFENVSRAKGLMDNVFASINSGVLTLDVSGCVALFNQAAGRVLHVVEEDVVGVPFVETFPALAKSVQPLIDRVWEHGVPAGPFEIKLSVPGSDMLELRVSLSPLKGAIGRVQGVAIVLDDLTEQRRLESRYQLFQRYLSPAVIERLPQDPYDVKLGGQRQEVTCLFADIRGFTDFSLHHTPETLVEVLNQYLAVGANAILAEEGTLDKFMGDAIVAFFNAPFTQEDHVLRAVRTAVRIREGIARLHQRLIPGYQLAYGIGISVGEAIVGNVGTSQRLDYTAIGPSVNMARRLQEAATAGQILLTPAVHRRVKEHVRVRSLSPGATTGGKQIPAYELLELL